MSLETNIIPGPSSVEIQERIPSPPTHLSGGIKATAESNSPRIPAQHHFDLGALKAQSEVAAGAHLDKHLVQQQQRAEFQRGADKLRETKRGETETGEDRERVHRQGGKLGGTKEKESGEGLGEGQQEKEGGITSTSRFLTHLTTSYPALNTTVHQITAHLPSIPLLSRLPLPTPKITISSIPVVSRIDSTLDIILSHIDSTFPIITAPPEKLVAEVAHVTDSWVAPVNGWLAKRLPEAATEETQTKKPESRKQAKKWSTKHSPGVKSYADTVAAAAGKERQEEDRSSSEEEEREEDHEKQDVLSNMELHRTYTLITGAVCAQLAHLEEARGYLATVPEHVPLVGNWLGEKVRGGKREERNKEGAGQQHGDGGGVRTKEKREPGEKTEPIIAGVGKQAKVAGEGVTVIGAEREV
ncbi:hypothetical protein BDZ91DRAFT_710174 [Kalaharituber pfeilii]|nr:hypothetical protein BDZ91DRAFT_710174 [Kalaharituber pfeilii]